MARDSRKPNVSKSSVERGVSSDELLKDAWEAMGRTETGGRVEGEDSQSALLASAASSTSHARTETAEEIAKMLAEATPPTSQAATRAEPRRRPAPTERPAPARQRRVEPLQTRTQPPPPQRRTAPPQPRQTQQPQQSQPRRRRGVGWIVFAAFWIVSILVGLFSTDDGGSGTPDIDISIPEVTIDSSDLTSTTIALGPGGTAVNIRDVAVGQCIETIPLGQVINDVSVVACEQPHQYELFATTQVSADAFPGDEVFTLAADACIPLFGSYVGEDYFDSDYYIDPIAPTAEGWQVGDRAVNCLLYLWPDGEEDVQYMTGSARNSGDAAG